VSDQEQLISKVSDQEQLISKVSDQEQIIKASDQDPGLLYCTNPYNFKTVTTKDRLNSCTLGGKKDSVITKKGYLNKQSCIEECGIKTF